MRRDYGRDLKARDDPKAEESQAANTSAVALQNMRSFIRKEAMNNEKESLFDKEGSKMKENIGIFTN